MPNINLKEFSGKEELKRFLLSTGTTPEGADILSKKGRLLLFEITGIDNRAANILKQDAISVSGDCAVPRRASTFEKGTCTAVLIVNERNLQRLTEKLSTQPFGLKEISAKLRSVFENHERKVFLLRSGEKELLLDKPVIMGILNVTPDSFSDGGLYLSVDRALKRCEEMLREGADIIDIGGESTRPGAQPVPLEEELKRVVPVVKAVREKLGNDFFISVDTYKAKVAEEALCAGADMVNDISGFRFDGEMVKLVAERRCPAVVMHIKGTPRNMQENPHYEDVVSEIISYFEDTLNMAQRAGVKREQLVIDPGIGFGKRVSDNLCIVKRLSEFKVFGLPILIGASRKSFIGAVTGESSPLKRLPGSLAVAGLAVKKGAKILRVHDVKETRQFLDMLTAVEEESC